ncbi:SixA phosphatase family protein [Croceivirga thetidis]|uniref:Histidine phosphatase family protein n=1 Tax=Croceivirga thetidis TaxID=2721623 RepID=A0ABX1GQQ2_9FLAO|nr:histidine phosphatase family protein [Croceivirga thetidis]NKI31924.1 histidine phosphatase family protein [Croceivirga thetidis]
MKTVIFIRHGKSSWDYDVSDKDRPLKERGISDAYLIGAKLSSFDLAIDKAFSSPANRALHTAIIVLRELSFDFKNLDVSDELYDFSGENVLQFLKGLNSSLDTVLVFGHNYAFTTLANTLGDSYIENLPTAGMVQINFKTNDWSKLGEGQSKNIVFPKHLR